LTGEPVGLITLEKSGPVIYSLLYFTINTIGVFRNGWPG